MGRRAATDTALRAFLVRLQQVIPPDVLDCPPGEPLTTGHLVAAVRRLAGSRELAYRQRDALALDVRDHATIYRCVGELPRPGDIFANVARQGGSGGGDGVARVAVGRRPRRLRGPAW